MMRVTTKCVVPQCCNAGTYPMSCKIYISNQMCHLERSWCNRVYENTRPGNYI